MRAARYLARGLLTLISIACSFALIAYIDTFLEVLIALSLPFLTVTAMTLA